MKGKNRRENSWQEREGERGKMRIGKMSREREEDNEREREREKGRGEARASPPDSPHDEIFFRHERERHSRSKREARDSERDFAREGEAISPSRAMRREERRREKGRDASL